MEGDRGEKGGYAELVWRRRKCVGVKFGEGKRLKNEGNVFLRCVA